MRIGVVTDFYYPWIAGPAIAVRTLAQGLAARGQEVFLLAPSPTGKPYLEREGSVAVQRVRTVPLPAGYQLRASLWPYRAAGDWIRRNGLQVVHIHHPFPLSAAAAFAARDQQVPVVATNHTIPACTLWGIRHTPLYGPAHAAFAWWLRSLLGRCAAVATPTRTAAGLLHDLGFSGEIAVISNGLDVARFAPGPSNPELRARLGLDSRPVVLYTGRLDPEKQMDVWLQAAARVARHRDVQWLIGGFGTERARLEIMAADLGLAHSVRFMGYLEERDLPQVYRLADVYCITSPVELQSISTLEAVASGLPVVAVRAGALPELVSDGVNGYLVPPGADALMAERLLAILDDTDLRRRMGQHSRTIALGHGHSTTVDQYERLLQKAVSGIAGREQAITA